MWLEDLDASSIPEADQEQHRLNGGELQARVVPDCSDDMDDWVNLRGGDKGPVRWRRRPFLPLTRR